MSVQEPKKHFLAEIRELVGGDRTLDNLVFFAKDSETAKHVANEWAIMLLGTLEEPVDLRLLDDGTVVWSRSFGPAL